MKTRLNVSIGKRIANLRRESLLSQKEFAEKVGVSAANLSHYERGVRIPPYEMLINVANCFNVSVDYLVGRTALRNGFVVTADDLEHIEKKTVWNMIQKISTLLLGGVLCLNQ